MSYILDALRRADAERQRGGVPGLHDQTGALGADGQVVGLAAPAGRRGQAVLWAGGAGLLLLALVAAWWLGRGSGAAGPAGPAADSTARSSPPAPAAVAPIQPTVQAPGQPSTRPGAQPAIQSPIQPSPTPPPVVAPPAAAALPSPAIPRPSAAPLPGRLPAPAPAPAPAEAASDPVRAWASLPESVRAALPPLAWSGVVYAERAEQRLVVVNGQVAREGEVLGTGLQLLQIRPKSVLLRWQGQRIEMPL